VVSIVADHCAGATGGGGFRLTALTWDAARRLPKAIDFTVIHHNRRNRRINK